MYNYELQKVRVYQFDNEGNFIRFYNGVREAGRELGIDYSSIVKCCNFKRRSAGGFLWSYVRDPFYYAKKKRFFNIRDITQL